MTAPGTARATASSSAGSGTRLLVLAVALTLAALYLLRSPGDEAVGASIPPASPARLVVPALDLRSAVVPIEVDTAGVLYPPDDVDVVGWWKRSAEAGSRQGQTVLTGHTVSTGGGVMDRLGELEPGDRIRVRTSEGVVRYRATSTRVLSRAELSAASRELFGQAGDPRLVLITCTDWDGNQYQSNIVVLADPV